MKPIRPHVEVTAAASFGTHDLLYVLFRRRWSILFFSLLGVGTGAAVFFLSKPTYQSEAELYVRYVVDTKAIGPDGATTTVLTPGGAGGDALLAPEVAILSSLDLAKEVTTLVGATNIVPKFEANRDRDLAAAFTINRGLKVLAPPKSSILQLRFQHPDPAITQIVLSNLVVRYLEMHNRVHRPEGIEGDLGAALERRQLVLRGIIAELQRIEQELGVANVEDARRNVRDQIARTRGDVYTTEAQLAERRASLQALSSLLGKSTNAPSGTATNLASVPSSRLNEYRSLRVRIDELTRKEQAMLVEYTELSPFVQGLRASLNRLVEERNRMESEYPVLASAEAVLARPGEAPGNATAERMTVATLDVPALEAKLKILTNQLELLKAEAFRLDTKTEEIRELTRQRELEEKQIIALSGAKNQAAIDSTLTKDRTPNIRITQQPTPAAPTTSATLKIAGSLAGGGILFALALAFGLEWYLDQSIRRRSHVENGLKVPLFLTIPRLRLPRRRPRKALAAPPKAQPKPALPPPSGNSPTASPSTGTAPTSRALALPDHGTVFPATGNDSDLGTWVEALRDRLIMHFESNDVTHKPKLIGLTSCGHGSGVTTLAAALAASLSETGDGRVLYVDMNPHRGVSVHPFHRGECNVALSQAFEEDGREAAQVQDNLYVVTITEPGSRRVGVVPRALAALMPKMKASDYDYIIFDCPPVSQTSVTAKIAGLLDITFLVLDSERTQTELAKNALALMGEGRAKVTAVLNKHRRYLPRSLDPDV